MNEVCALSKGGDREHQFISRDRVVDSCIPSLLSVESHLITRRENSDVSKSKSIRTRIQMGEPRRGGWET